MRIKEKTVKNGGLAQGAFCSDGYDLQLKRTSTRIALILLLEMGLFQVFAVLITILQTLLDELLIPSAAHIVGQSLHAIGYFSCFVVPARIFCRSAKKKGEYRVGFYRGYLPRTMPLLIFAVIAINFAAAYVNSYVIPAIFPGLEGLMAVMESEPLAWYEIVMSFVTVAIVPAICEEILFRGVILTHLLPYGRTVAIIGSGLLFGLMHGNPLQLFYTSLLGVVLGYVYLKTRSIAVCMVLHFVNNSISVLQSALYDRSPNASGIAIGMELGIIVIGAVSMFLLLRREMGKPRPEDTGCFGRIHELHADVAEYPVTSTKRVQMFFSPAMIIYVVLSVLTMGFLTFVFGIAFFVS